MTVRLRDQTVMSACGLLLRSDPEHPAAIQQLDQFIRSDATNTLRVLQVLESSRAVSTPVLEILKFAAHDTRPEIREKLVTIMANWKLKTFLGHYAVEQRP